MKNEKQPTLNYLKPHGWWWMNLETKQGEMLLMLSGSQCSVAAMYVSICWRKSACWNTFLFSFPPFNRFYDVPNTSRHILLWYFFFKTNNNNNHHHQQHQHQDIIFQSIWHLFKHLFLFLFLSLLFHKKIYDSVHKIFIYWAYAIARAHTFILTIFTISVWSAIAHTQITIIWLLFVGLPVSISIAVFSFTSLAYCFSCTQYTVQ